jgi:hypothetical protein
LVAHASYEYAGGNAILPYLLAGVKQFLPGAGMGIAGVIFPTVVDGQPG